MRKIKAVLRLKGELRLSNRQIARSLSISVATVHDYLHRAEKAQVQWPLPGDINDDELVARLFPASASTTQRPLPDWGWVHKELKKKGVTLQLLWDEYKAQEPGGLQYSQFCEHYRRFAKTVDPVMRLEHKAGEKMFVDFAGQTVPITNQVTGEVKQAQIFVAVLGASNYTYAEATMSQELPYWIQAHVRAFEYFGGVPELIVPDNLKTGVHKACRYEPDLNPTYQSLAIHYGTAILPTRVAKPRDKAKVETGVKIVENWILAALRNQTFFSLGQLNAAISLLLERLNGRPFKKLDGCRRSVFEALEKPALRPLPIDRYQYEEWQRARVNIDYHIEVDGHYYSVPYTLLKQQVDVRLTPNVLEVLHKGSRVASHPRSFAKGKHTTLSEHMPKSHQRYREWTPSRMIQWAGSIGPYTARLAETILNDRPHPEMGFRTCLGIIRLAKAYPKDRVEAACERALAIGGLTLKSVRSILDQGLDQQPCPRPLATITPIFHANVRGADYYKETDHADPSHDQQAEHPETDRHGQGADRAVEHAPDGRTVV